MEEEEDDVKAVKLGGTETNIQLKLWENGRNMLIITLAHLRSSQYEVSKYHSKEGSC